VEKRRIPMVSILLFLSGGGLWVVFKQRNIKGPWPSAAVALVCLGFLLYPFVRSPAALPFVSGWAPSTARTEVILHGLLTNVYRSFDVRDENRVYDRLAMSVLGDQLAQIYLQNRKALAFENRGGARATVDEVNILSVNQVEKSETGGFAADAAWTVSGSVSHFGHTHYRQNRYHARVLFVMDGSVWKVREIELIEQERVL
jgi:hypothetical protein